MNSYEKLLKAISRTKILKSRKNLLFTFGNTILPYLIIADSSINKGHTVVRRGEVNVERPRIFFAGEEAIFEGFEFGKDDNDIDNIKYALMCRGISFPNLTYKNSTTSLEVLNSKSDDVIYKSLNELEDVNDIRTSVIVCDESLWNLSLLHYVFTQVIRSSSSNLKEYMERYPFK